MAHGQGVCVLYIVIWFVVLRLQLRQDSTDWQCMGKAKEAKVQQR